jgi:hypothetical protein
MAPISPLDSPTFFSFFSSHFKVYRSLCGYRLPALSSASASPVHSPAASPLPNNLASAAGPLTSSREDLLGGDEELADDKNQLVQDVVARVLEQLSGKNGGSGSKKSSENLVNASAQVDLVTPALSPAAGSTTPQKLRHKR